METLYSLRKFTEKYPQKKRGKLQYTFIGGTAIRLAQEKVNFADKRSISDFDLFVFENGNYPVHSFDVKRGFVPLKKEQFYGYVDSTNVKGKKYFFMDGSFLALSKTCAIDNPREKDYHDLKFLYDTNQIDKIKLKGLFESSEILTNNSNLSIDIFNSLMKRKNSQNINLFQSFPHYVNLVDEFDKKDKAKKIIRDYSFKDKNKSGYALSSILYNSHLLIREIGNFKDEAKEKDKLNFLEDLLLMASFNDHVDFDRKVHQEYLPQLRYASNKNEKMKSIGDPKF